MYYRIVRTAFSRNKEYKRAVINCIKSEGKEYSTVEFYKKYGTLFHGMKTIECVNLTIKVHEGDEFPDFITVDTAFCAVNNKVIKFLNDQKINCYIVKTTIENYQQEYQMVFFEDEVKVNMEESNLELLNGEIVTKGKIYIDSEFVINEPTENSIKIAHLDIRPNILFCSNDIKNKLEGENFAGIEYKIAGISSI